jgi:hypothetical protein
VLEHFAHLVSAGHFDFLAHLHDQIGMPPKLLYFLREARALIFAQFNLFFHFDQFLVHAFHFRPPLNRVHFGLNDLVFFWLVIRSYLLRVCNWVEEVDFCLFNIGFSFTAKIFGWTVFAATRQVRFVSLGLNLDSVELLRAMQIGIIL